MVKIGFFSGSAVVDKDNTSGFFDGIEGGGLVAIYTQHVEDPHSQQQAIAYSKDNGRIWIRPTLPQHGNNLVLATKDDPLKSPDFRDPKIVYVFSANEQKLKFYNFNTSLLQNKEANSERQLFLQPKKEVQFTFLADDSAAVLYIEGKGALSTRMFSMPGKPWGFFSQGAKLTIKNLQIAN